LRVPIREDFPAARITVDIPELSRSSEGILV
jgi:hypothetical protein